LIVYTVAPTRTNQQISRGTKLAEERGMTRMIRWPRTRTKTVAGTVRRDLLRDERGAVFTEYTIVLAFAGLVVAIALAALGPKVVNSYSSRRGVLYDSQHP
jgi:Flp pilus assembly pilin Flp